MGLEQFYSNFKETYILRDNKYVKVLLSNIDNSIVGDSYKSSLWLYKLGITESIQNINNTMYGFANIGYNPTNMRWYCWDIKSPEGTPRIIGSYGLGSIISEGSLGYTPSSREDMLRYVISKYSQFNNSDYEVSYIMKTSYIEVTVANWQSGYSDIYYFPQSWGNGVWTAKTIADAKIMAINALSTKHKVSRQEACVNCSKI